MEEPPRIEKVTSSRGISLSDAGSILQSFIDTLDNDHDGTTSSHHDNPPSTPAVTATSSTANNANTTPRKTRQEIEEEAILKQFDLLAAKPSGLVSDDTHERLKLIRDSILGEVTGKIVLPSSVVKKIGDDVDATTTNGNSRGENTPSDENGTNNVKEEEEDGQQFTNELNEAEEELQRQEDEMKRREAKRAKKEKKSAKKARKEARRESKRRGMEMSDGGGGGSNKRIKLEEDS